MRSKQFAALPFRIRDFDLEVMLITTRQKGRWSLPKGSVIGKKKPHQIAAIEAFEEAGVTGVVRKKPLGRFKHRKRSGLRKRALHVAVFPFRVLKQETWWPEKGERQ